MTKIPTKRAPATRSRRRYNSWALDMDYVDKLTDAEAEWLNKFCYAHYHGNPKKAGDLADTPEARKASYKRNNEAQRDSYNKNERVDLKEVSTPSSSPESVENNLIAILDADAVSVLEELLKEKNNHKPD